MNHLPHTLNFNISEKFSSKIQHLEMKFPISEKVKTKNEMSSTHIFYQKFAISSLNLFISRRR